MSKRKIDAQKLRETGQYRELPDYEIKRLPTFVTKADEEQGIIEQIVAVIGNVDDGDDMIMPGAFVKTIEENARRVRVLDNHNSYSIHNAIGKPVWMGEIGRDELPPEVLDYAPDATGGLMTRTQYAMKTDNGRDAFQLVSGGFVPESSIGYDPTQIDFIEMEGPGGGKRRVRQLKEIRLWEYSNVLWGMNPATATLLAKAKAKAKEDNMPQDETKAILPYQNLSLATRERAWDDAEAEGRVRNWASDGSGELEDIDWDKYRRAFLYRDPENDEEVGGYKLGYADIVDGELTAVPRGIFAVAGALQGARGGVDIPEADQERAKTQVSRYYAKMRDEFDDESLFAPWHNEETNKAACEEVERLVTDHGIFEDGKLIGFMTTIVGHKIDEQLQSESNIKAGRAISKANAARIKAVIDQIHAAATSLESMLEPVLQPTQEQEPDDDEGEDMAAHEDEDNKGRDTEAGPPDEAPTEAELLKQKIELYQKLTNITE